MLCCVQEASSGLSGLRALQYVLGHVGEDDAELQNAEGAGYTAGGNHTLGSSVLSGNKSCLLRPPSL